MSRGMFERWTEKARRAMFVARQNAFEEGAEFIEGRHLLMALLGSGEPSVARMLGRLEIDSDALQGSLPAPSGRPTGPKTREIPFGPALRAALEVAGAEAGRSSEGRLGGSELLVGLLSTGHCLPPNLLSSRKYTLATLRAAAAPGS